ncbi:hypothetical protein D2E40_20460 [Mycobacteroides abscessus]|nr:hypothetical protein D2E40_20460 [Mycobacteroides abscessus]
MLNGWVPAQWMRLRTHVCGSKSSRNDLASATQPSMGTSPSMNRSARATSSGLSESHPSWLRAWILMT